MFSLASTGNFCSLLDSASCWCRIFIPQCSLELLDLWTYLCKLCFVHIRYPYQDVFTGIWSSVFFQIWKMERMLHPTQKWICWTLVQQLFGEFSVRNVSVRKAETSIIKEHNPSMHIFNVAVVYCTYMFWLPQSNYLLGVYQKCKKEFIWRAVSGQDFGRTEDVIYICIYVFYF